MEDPFGRKTASTWTHGGGKPHLRLHTRGRQSHSGAHRTARPDARGRERCAIWNALQKALWFMDDDGDMMKPGDTGEQMEGRLL